MSKYIYISKVKQKYVNKNPYVFKKNKKKAEPKRKQNNNNNNKTQNSRKEKWKQKYMKETKSIIKKKISCA